MAPSAPTSTGPGTPTTRARAVRHPWRVAIVAVGVLVVVNLVAIGISRSDTEPTTTTGLPSAIESIAPGNGDLVRLTDTVAVDLGDLYTGVLVIDRAEVPEDQIERRVGLGQVSFRPGPDKDLEKFAPGPHTVTVLYWPQGKDRPEQPASFTWTFKAGA